MDRPAGLGFDDVDPALRCPCYYVVAERGEYSDTGGLFCVLRRLFCGRGGIHVFGVRSERGRGEDALDGFGFGDVYQNGLVFEEGGDEE